MRVPTAMLLIVLASGAQAAPFDDLKENLASCLRFEMGSAHPQRGAASAPGAREAVERCSVEVDRLDRADGRRLRGDGGVSPSTKEVIQAALRGGFKSAGGSANGHATRGVHGRGDGLRTVGMRY